MYVVHRVRVPWFEDGWQYNGPSFCTLSLVLFAAVLALHVAEYSLA